MTFKKGMVPWNKGVPRDEETKKKIGSKTSEWLKSHEHPKGMLGKKHDKSFYEKLSVFKLTEEQKKKMSEATIRNYRKKYGEDIEKVCPQCQKKFFVHPSPSRLKKVYCSDECRLKVLWSKTRKHPKNYCIDCGKRLPRTNNIRCYKCNGLAHMGDKAPYWKGGITPENKLARTVASYREWRKAVFERDDFTCHQCQKRGNQIHAHHIESFADNPEKRLLVENGVTLCEQCHSKVHKRPIIARSVYKKRKLIN